ncbi:MAG: lysophospholipid acyltransferase family protein [Verrucomicrobia bacterium]|nr:lysophospholipid acyltransferase family protein [Verrucomicrobiota bacterium]
MADLAYWTVVNSLRALFSPVCRLEESGTRKVPAGPWILASNHLSHFDPTIIAGAFSRPIDFLAMRELFRPAWFGLIMRSCNVIPVGRKQADTTALKTALTRLKAGRIVGVFPEGGLRAGATSVLEGSALTEGVSLLAAKSGCPVRPCLIVGSDQLYVGRNWFRRPRVVVAVGKPIPAPARGEKRKDWTEKLARAMRSLFEEVKERHSLEEIVWPKTPQERWKAGR